MQRVLFTLLKSPFEKNETQTMDVIAGDNDRGVILFEDAIYYATVEQMRKELLSKNFSIFALNEEMEARGYSEFTAEGVELIGYDKAVDIIMERYDRVVSL